MARINTDDATQALGGFMADDRTVPGPSFDFELADDDVQELGPALELTPPSSFGTIRKPFTPNMPQDNFG